MNIEDINKAVLPIVAARGCFLVETSVGKDNDILITIESEKAFVTLEDCEAVNDAFTAIFDRDVEDYSLTVSSAGLDRPFKTPAQYTKAIGSKVEVSFRGGRKIVAELTDFREDKVTLRWKALTAVEGQKKKVVKEFVETFGLSDINAVTPYMDFD